MSEEAIAEGVLAKVDEDKKLVFGWASIIKDSEGKILLDRQDDFIDDEEELEKSAYSYVLNSRDGGEMHINRGVSTMVESVVFSKEKQQALGIPEGTVPVGWWIGFKVNDDRVWDQVKKGDYSGFSVHGTGQRQKTDLNPGTFTEIEKRKFDAAQRRKLAEEGKALPDGSFPIDSRGDLSNALQAIGRAKNRARVLRHIRARAKDMGAEDMLPDWAIDKSDCGCGGDCPGCEGGLVVSKRYLSLLTKATIAKGQGMNKYRKGTRYMIGQTSVGKAKMPYIMPKGKMFCVYNSEGKKVAEYKTAAEAGKKMMGLVPKGQGYDDRLDESLGAKDNGRASQQSFASRRAESRGARKPKGSFGFGKR